MSVKLHASLSVSVSAVRELLEEALRSRVADARAARALSLAVDALDALWCALESKEQSDARREQDFTEIFEFSPACCVLTDVNGRVRRANPAAAGLFGVAAAEIEQRPLAAFFAPQQQALMPAYLRDLMARGVEPITLRWCASIGGAGGGVPVEVSVRETGRSQGRLGGLCWVFRRLGDSPAVAPETAVAAGTPRLDLPLLPQTPR
jgi:PAS domain S-box-containing protein